MYQNGVEEPALYYRRVSRSDKKLLVIPLDAASVAGLRLKFASILAENAGYGPDNQFHPRHNPDSCFHEGAADMLKALGIRPAKPAKREARALRKAARKTV